MTKPTKCHVRPAKTQISLGIRPVWSESSLVCLKKTRILSYPLSAQWRHWSDWVDAQADLTLCWAHMAFCWFCHNAAQLFLVFWVTFWNIKLARLALLCNDVYSSGHIETVFEPRHEKTNKMACAPSEDSDQPGHPPSLINVFAVLMKKAWILSYPLSAQRRFWSDWMDAQADLSHHWAHMPFLAHLSEPLGS